MIIFLCLDGQENVLFFKKYYRVRTKKLHSIEVRKIKKQLLEKQILNRLKHIQFCLALKNPTIFNIIRWVAWMDDSWTKILMFQVLSLVFHIFLQNSLQKLFQFIFLFFYKKRNKECFYEKNNAWNIQHLVDESFVPANQ